VRGDGARAGAAPAGVASRRAAWRALRGVHERGAWSAPAVSAVLEGSGLDPRDRAFAANLAYETLRWEGTLDWALARVVTRPLAQVEEGVLDMLRLGAWQVLRGRMPERAAVSTTVEAARAELPARATGFVNGVLRALARRRDSLPWPARDDARGLGLALGYPAWIVAAARERLGERAAGLLDAGNSPPGVTLRALGEREELRDELRAAGIDARPGRHAPEALRVPGADPGRLACVEEGRATPQDEASMLVVRALAGPALARGHLPEGWTAADLAAAPGGKSTHLAQLGARVVAIDRRPSRARLIVATARRLRLERRVTVAVGDATAPPLAAGAFDGVLLDAPCSGLGTVRRRPELRWRRSAGEPATLAALQLRMLEAAAALLRPGGRLTYSVCTWTRAETVEVVRAFLAVAGDLVAPADSGLPERAGLRLADDPGVQLTPDHDDVDGMYVCSFTRRR
jgi:16S rRNA (cytosine967-C5)-methyltransferase